MKKSYLLSILVPTHNRSVYAISCVKSLLNIDSELIQIVVHDTSNDDLALKLWAENVKDERLTYIHFNHRLSMTENHEAVINYANGLYTIIIGDDDSVSSKVVDIAELAKSKNIDILVPKIKAVYSWPDFKTKFFGLAHAGKLYLDKYNSELILKNSEHALNNMLEKACQGTDGMPKLYHGMVRTTLIHELKSKNSNVFFGVSPDVSASISLALIAKNFWEVDYPFTLPGASGGSNTGRSALNKHKGDLESDEHIKPFTGLEWPKQIPEFFSVETVWSQAAWVTILNQKETDPKLLNKFNLNKLYALCFLKHWHYYKFTKDAFNNSKSLGFNVSLTSIFYYLVSGILDVFFSKFKRLLNPLPSGGKKVLGTFETVEEAVIALDKSLSSGQGIK